MIIYYQDPEADFYPLDLFRHQAKLLIGTTPFGERKRGMFLPPPWLEPLYARPRPKGSCLYLRATTILLERIGSKNREVVLRSKEGRLVGFLIARPPYPRTREEIEARIRKIRESRTVRTIDFYHLWELIDQNGGIITSDFDRPKRAGSIDSRAALLGKEIVIGKGSRIDPYAVIDAREGPVIIGEKVRIKSNSVIEGPAYIGSETVIDGAIIRGGTSIGKSCRIGGEVEASIILSYTNKHHEGFLGHSYLGSWINLGALTTNSDLKNNYHPVRIRYKGKEFETGLLKVGCFIGDHVKTGIGTLIPTGGIIGPCTNIFGGGMIDRYVPAFRWGRPGSYEEYEIEKLIDTARTVMARRGVSLTKGYERVIRAVHRLETGGGDV